MTEMCTRTWIQHRLSEAMLSPTVKQLYIWNQKTHILHSDCYIQLCVYSHLTTEISLNKRKWLKNKTGWLVDGWQVVTSDFEDKSVV